MPSTSFSDMPTLAAPTSTPSPPFHRRRKSWARKLERCCCQTFAFFPLIFVYGLTTWAVYVEVDVSFLGLHTEWAFVRAGLGIVLYTLANVSYTIAVFTSPGSPSDPRQDVSSTGRKAGGYEGLPTDENGGDAADGPVPEEWMTTVTAKSTGQPRYCKKCNNIKPDRTHHCSTCGRCVLKMDHHCPWLATCVGLRNYKAFMLFLVYTSLFCWASFAVAATWVWAEIINGSQMEEGLRVVNVILLSVLAGIIGLVLSGFTAWHIYLCLTNQTTIESLEKTRYLSPLKKSMEHQFQENRNYLGRGTHSAGDIAADADQSLGDRLREIHANTLPGVLRPEEGDSSLDPFRIPSPMPPAAASASPAHQSLRRSYASLEAQRERERYNTYLDEQDSEQLPNAFDLGWKRNLRHVLGDEPLYWFFPICNTSGNGWQWEVSPRWHKARDRIASERERRAREEAHWSQGALPQRSFEPPPRDLRWTPGQGFIDRGRHTPSESQEGRSSSLKHVNGDVSMQMQPLDRRKHSSSSDVDDYDTSGDEEPRQKASVPRQHGAATANWNDIPEDFLDPKAGQGRRSRSQGRAKGY